MTLVYNRAPDFDSTKPSTEHLSGIKPDSKNLGQHKLVMSVHCHNGLFFASLCRGDEIMEQTEGFKNAAEASLAGFRLFELFTREAGRFKPYRANQTPILWQ